jgi:hypothetical protein
MNMGFVTIFKEAAASAFAAEANELFLRLSVELEVLGQATRTINILTFRARSVLRYFHSLPTN